MISTEMDTSRANEIRWKYHLNKEIDGKDETREVAETISVRRQNLDGRRLR